MSEENKVELTGKEFLNKYEIKKKTCDKDKPFFFISYAHHEHDMGIVFKIFNLLYDKGYNLWIDAANLPKGAESWKVAANNAIQHENCKGAFFFRSENSLIKQAIRDELKNLNLTVKGENITSIDIWQKEGNTANNYRSNLYVERRDVTIIDDINDHYMNPDCNAIRFLEDCHRDFEELAKEMIELLEDKGVKSSKLAEEEDDTIGDFFAGGYLDERLFYDGILDFENKKEPIRHNKLDDMKIYDLEEMMEHEVLRDYVNRRIEDYFDVNSDGFEDIHATPRHVIEEFGKETIISEVLEELRANPDVDFVYSKSLKVLKAGIEKETENIKKIETDYKPYSEDGKIWIKKTV